MGNLFDTESPVMQSLGRLVDCIILNLLTLLCSIPVITYGAAFSALYDSLERLHENEGQIYRGFFRAFVTHLKKATALWTILTVMLLLILNCLRIYYIEGLRALTILALFMLIVWVVISVWVFPLLVKSNLSVWRVLKYSLIWGIRFLPYTFLLIILYFIPLGLLMYPEAFVTFTFVFILGWLSMVAEISRILVKKVCCTLDSMNH